MQRSTVPFLTWFFWLKLSRCSFQVRTLGQKAPYLGITVNMEHQNLPEISYKTPETSTASGFDKMPTDALKVKGHISNPKPREDARVRSSRKTALGIPLLL